MRTSKGSAIASKETVHLWIKMMVLVSFLILGVPWGGNIKVGTVVPR